MLDFPNNQMVIHFVGIGGIGMSGIAELLHNLGCKVQGSDRAEGANIERLREKNIPVMIGHDTSHVEGVSVLVVSSAIPTENPEIAAARAHNIPVIQRAEMLAELMRLKKSVAIGGTHGKTTTTSIVAALFEAADYDPTVINGGIINSYGSNTRTGQGEWLVAEADESDGSFIKLPASIAVITNIDPEHMEHYGDFQNLQATFLRFVQNIPFYGFAVLCADHNAVLRLMAQITDRKVISYGFSPQAMVRALDLEVQAEGMAFTVEAKFDDTAPIRLENLFLPMYGEHNVQNALAGIAIGLHCDFPHDVIRKTLADFSGVKRRFTLTGIVNGVKIIDDYAHHPVEILAVLKAARSICSGKLIAIVQPHRYSRLHDLFEEFQTAFHDADIVMISDVYEAGEEPIDGIHSDALAQAMSDAGHKQVVRFSDANTLPQQIGSYLQQQTDGQTGTDMVIFLGAGSSTHWAYDLPDGLSAYYADSKG